MNLHLINAEYRIYTNTEVLLTVYNRPVLFGMLFHMLKMKIKQSPFLQTFRGRNHFLLNT